MYAVSPVQAERFYLRMLLCHRRGPTSFQDIRTVDGVIYDRYKLTCQALGLLESDDEWLRCMRDAAVSQMPSQLRDLFVVLLVFANPSDPAALWAEHGAHMCEDYQRALRPDDDPNLAIARAVRDIDDLLRMHGYEWSLARYPELPQLQDFAAFLQQAHPESPRNRLLASEASYDQEELITTMEGLATANEAQRAIFDTVTAEIALPQERRQGCYFLCGEGGAGKSYISNLLLAYVRLSGRVAIAVASTGLASLSLRGGTTAHARFKIPLRVDENSTCNIRKQDQLGELLRAADLFIWDECSMIHK
ncbi:helitron helicase-like protein, partial [Achlya hypogyna]